MKKVPMRTCVGCGISKEKKQLIRVIRGSDGTIAVDRTGRANGRGAYLCPNPECLAKARKKRALARALQTEIPDAVYEQLEAELQDGSEPVK